MRYTAAHDTTPRLSFRENTYDQVYLRSCCRFVNRQCVACHIVADADGEVLAGRNARTGPNLYGIAGRQIGSDEEFRYGDSIVELGEMDGGTVWTEELFVGYVQDPTGWLHETLDNRRARGKMAYRVRDEEEAINIYAYLATFGAEEGDMMEEEGEAASN